MAADDGNKVKAGTKRQQAKRKRDEEKYAAMGIKEFRLLLSLSEVAMLEELRVFRGGATAYDMGEYISTLVRRDYERMKEEIKRLGSCAFCGEPLPMGCKNALGVPRFQGRSECFYDREERKLRP